MESELLNIFSENIGSTSQVAEYQANINFFDEIENFLLGSFDKNGKYTIPKQIAEELVKIKKIYSYAFGETAFCESENNFDKIGKIQFAVKMQQEGKNMIATLCVVQEISKANGIVKKNAITEIEQYSALNSPSFVNDCFERFNIHSKKEDGLEKKDYSQIDAQITLARLKYLAQKNLQLDKQEVEFKSLVDKKLALLAKYKFGKKIIGQYNEMLNREKNGKFMPGSKGYYRHLNSLLDKIVDEHKSELLLDTMFVAQWGKINSSATSKIKGEVIKDVLAENLVQTEKIEDKKEALDKKESAPKVEMPKRDDKKSDFGHKPFGPHHHPHHIHGPHEFIVDKTTEYTSKNVGRADSIEHEADSSFVKIADTIDSEIKAEKLKKIDMNESSSIKSADSEVSSTKITEINSEHVEEENFIM